MLILLFKLFAYHDENGSIVNSLFAVSAYVPTAIAKTKTKAASIVNFFICNPFTCG